MNPATRVRAAYVRLRRRALYRRVLRRGTPLIILRYHAVGDAHAVGRYVHPGLAVSAARFREHVRLLVRRFRIVLPDEIPDVIASPGSARPAALITFDDGFIDNYELATPILAEEGARGAFYIATHPLRSGSWLWTSELWRLLPHLPAGEVRLPGSPDLAVPAANDDRSAVGRRLTKSLSALPDDEREQVMNELSRLAGRPRGEGLEGTFVTPKQLRAMRDAGMTIGAHTRSHPQLDLLPAGFRSDELRGSRVDLEAILEEPVRHLAYPNPGGNGTIEPAVRNEAARSGFQTAVTSVTGPIEPSADLLRLPRLGVYAGAQERQLFDALAVLP